MFAKSTAIVPAKGGAIVKVNTALVTVKADNVPAAIRQESAKLLVAFPVVGMVPEEKKALLDLYGRAIDGFEESVIMAGIDWLLWHNPRHTPTFSTHPAPADLLSACKRIRATGASRIETYFLGNGRPSYSEYRDGDKFGVWGFEYHESVESALSAQVGPESFEVGCLIPPALVAKYMRDSTSASSNKNRLATMPAEQFDKFTEFFFADGVRDKLVALRKEHAEREAEIGRARLERAAAEAEASRKWVGKRVFHDKFGYGCVAEVDVNILVIDFNEAGRRRVVESFVSRSGCGAESLGRPVRADALLEASRGSAIAHV